MIERAAPPSARSPRVAIALHDVSPLTLDLSQRLIAHVESIAGRVPLTLLVIPHHHGLQRIDRCRNFRRFVDARIVGGDEVALHGMRHRDDERSPASASEWWCRRVLSGSEAEFAVLSGADARRRIEEGLAIFTACGWCAAGFVPPAWQMSNATREVLSDYAFRYATTRSAILLLPSGVLRVVPALSLSARSAVRRFLSQRWAAQWTRTHRNDEATRLALHPIDAMFPDMREVWAECLQTLLSVAQPVTKSCLCEAQV